MLLKDNLRHLIFLLEEDRSWYTLYVRKTSPIKLNEEHLLTPKNSPKSAGWLPFIGMELIKIRKQMKTCVYRKTTNKGLILCPLQTIPSNEYVKPSPPSCTKKTAVQYWKENKQRSAPSVYKQENCRWHKSSRGQTTVNK